MPAGAFYGGAPSSDVEPGRMTVYVGIVCAVSASAGLLFGYDNGIAGGVVAMPEFHYKFFPNVATHSGSTDPYCKYDDKLIQLFVSCLFIAGAIGAVIASHTSSKYGRRITLLWGGISFLIGSLLQAFAVHVAMLISGRLLLGLGVGLSAQAAPVFLSEMAPARLRGAMNIMFQLMITIGILAAQLIAYGAQYIKPWGWHLALGLAAVPALILVVGAWCLPETPNSLAERGKEMEALAVLQRIRGTREVYREMADISMAAEMSRSTGNQWATIIKPAYRPQLCLAIIVPALQQLTGINSVIFYAPQLFSSLGKGTEAALMTTCIIGAVNVGTTIVALCTVDRFGRRFWFLEGGIQMIAAEVVIGAVLGTQFTADGHLPHASIVVVIAMICIFIAGFAWSWGPLAWLVCSEVQPMETRSSGYAITVASNFLLTFVIGQSFLSMLCTMKYGIFFFFAGWVFLMTIFAMAFIPETKGVPIEELQWQLFPRHWFWGRLIAGTTEERRWSDAEKRGPDATPGVRVAQVQVEMEGADASTNTL